MTITHDFESRIVPVANHRFYNIGDVHQLLAYARNLEAQNEMARKLRTWAEVGEGAKRKFEELSHKGWDWRSFCNGFIEGTLYERSVANHGPRGISDTMREAGSSENGQEKNDNIPVESDLPGLSVEDHIRLYRASGGSVDGEKRLRACLEATKIEPLKTPGKP